MTRTTSILPSSEMRSEYLYRVYGLTIRVDQPLSGLVAAPHGAPIDVDIHLLGAQSQADAPVPPEVWRVSPQRYLCAENGFTAWTVQCADGCYYRLQCTYEDVTDNYIIHPEGRRVIAVLNHADRATPDDLFTFISKRILGYVLRVRGDTCLHANVVAVAGRAIAILGHSGAGKSTTTAGLLTRGHAMLVDDIATIYSTLHNDQTVFLVQPGFPWLTLEPSTIEHFYGSITAFRRVYAFVEKRYVPLALPGAAPGSAAAWRFEPQPLPLGAVYVLGAFADDEVEPAIEAVGRAAGLLALSSHVYVGYMLDQAGRAREFELLGRMASSVPIRCIRRSRGLAYLPQLCAAIEEDVRRLTA